MAFKLKLTRVPWIFLLVSLISSIPKLVDSDAATASSSSSSSYSSSAASIDEVSSSGPNTPSDGHNQLPETLSEMGSIVPGVFKEYMPQPVFYESVVPAIYRYQAPTWNKTEITFNSWYTCVSETIPYRYSCPVTFHMNRALENLHVDFDGLHPISDIRAQSIQDSMKDYYERLTGHSEFCDTIQKHFSGIWTEPSDLQLYLSALQSCSRGSDLHPYVDRDLISDYHYNLREPYTKMENNFYKTFFKRIASAASTATNSSSSNSTTSSTTPATGNIASATVELVASAVLSNARSSLQAAVIGQFYAEKNRWVHADKDCRSGYIPTSLVTPEKFNDSLSAILKMSIFHHEADLSIPPGQTSKYYSLPLSDCTHTTDVFVVRVLVPILKKFRAEVLQLVHVHNIPFLYKDHICRIKLPIRGTSQAGSRDESIVGDQWDPSSMYLYHTLTHRAYRTNCKPNELCKISQYMLDIQRSDPCVSSLLSRNDTGIRIFCDFECLPKSDYVLPAVVRVASNKFVVTGSSLSFRITCGRLAQSEKLYYVKPDHVGAALIKLPCHCRLIFSHFNVYYGGNACDLADDILTDHGRIVHADEEVLEQEDDISVTPIIPFMFSKVKGKNTWQHHDKTANSVNHQHHEQNGDNYYFENLAEGQLVNLTEIIDSLRIENYIRSSQIRREKEERNFKGMDFYAEKLQSGESLDDHEGKGGGVGCLFWSVFITSVVLVLGLQIYIILMFRRFTQTSYPRDQQILYRVEPDTESLGG